MNQPGNRDWLSKAANTVQVGGDHYASAYQHWDLALKVGAGYLESAATKYLCRWRKKAGIKDLEKALHYTYKAGENVELIWPGRIGHITDWSRKYVERNRASQHLNFSSWAQWVCYETDVFADSNQIPAEERAIIKKILSWTTRADLAEAVAMLKLFVTEQELHYDVNVVDVKSQDGR